MTRPTLKLVSLALLAASTAAVAIAATPPAATAITTRQANFKKMGGAMKALGEQLKSGTPDKAAMVAAAQTIATTSRQQGALFPAGSGPMPGVKTDALPAIWTDRATFDAQMAKLVTESAKLTTVAGTGDVAAIGAQMKATGAVCGACHRQFRHDDH